MMERTKRIMTVAWNIARQGAAKHGGCAHTYIAAALRMAWNGETTILVDRKSLARQLDRIASRAGHRAATQKQVWFLAGLMSERGEDERSLFGLNAGNSTLSVSMASTFISSYLRDRAA
ncbi:hypothetical protein [Nitrospirillum sp. BR 11163]|uniref:hypothetical protein n=1 Tax=Nitrospirillum sp. BR 11163 TaxID=3104323 RepID=UPI002AFF9A93|nr:hypothetical protein [Nitrospirillum sp. BR 11163]MEA1674126.1 hypothetical protein [Nitrospirillum sp. BR 11163]